MKRKDMDPRYQWDITHISPDETAWEAAMAEAEQAVAGLAALPGTLRTGKEGLKKGLDAAYAAMEKIELPFIYANLHKCADGSEPEHQSIFYGTHPALISEEVFEKVQRENLLNAEVIAKAYKIEPKAIEKVLYFPPAKAVKIGMSRTRKSGSPGDTDVYGAQQHAPLLTISLDI